jgi:CubicO group peptidase (beta-lactamase class C family)
MVLGALLVSAYGKPLSDIWLEYVRKINFETEQEIGPASAIKKDRSVPTAYCPVRQRQLIGEVHDENAWAMGGFAGHAGLFGSGEGLTRFLRALWRHEDSRQVFSENFAEAASPGDSLLGWRKGVDESARTFAEGRGCGQLGFTGTAFWVDPLTKSYAVVLTNRVISGRVSPAIKRFRAEVFAELWNEIRCHEEK